MKDISLQDVGQRLQYNGMLPFYRQRTECPECPDGTWHLQLVNGLPHFWTLFDTSKWLWEDRVQHIQSAPDKITPDLRWLQNQKCSHIFSSSRIQQEIFNWERRGWEKEPGCFPRWAKSPAGPANMIRIDALTKSTADITARKVNLWIGRINVCLFI
jgi:hypothetical protein